MKEILDRPAEPLLYCSMEIGVFVGISDEFLVASGASPPASLVHGSGLLGWAALGVMVLGSPEGA